LWSAYEDAGLSHDASVGWAERPGFRAGICCEYPAFDLRSRRQLGVRERPLVAMEASLYQYLGLDDEDVLGRLVALREACGRYGGEFTLLWHNNRLERRGERRVYREILAG
jgi:hypothetical protein